MHSESLGFLRHAARIGIACALFALQGCGSGQSVQGTGPADGTPSISGTPATTVAAGARYDFIPTATGTAPLTFSVDSRPAWATFSVTTGELAGTPTGTDTGTYANIVIHVSNANGSATLGAFSITVTSSTSNHAPVISGVPSSTVQTGQPYSFVPTASDPDSDPLTFSIRNKPAWASFDPATGALTGTPSSTDAGTFADIVLSVSDGSLQTDLPAFTIDVVQAADSVSLDWVLPTMNSDGSTLTNLAAIGIYYGNDPGQLDQKIVVASATATSYVVRGLSPGTWYFVVKAINSAGEESPASNLASRTL